MFFKKIIKCQFSLQKNVAKKIWRNSLQCLKHSRDPQGNAQILLEACLSPQFLTAPKCFHRLSDDEKLFIRYFTSQAMFNA
jgi:hypothetical protein